MSEVDRFNKIELPYGTDNLGNHTLDLGYVLQHGVELNSKVGFKMLRIIASTAENKIYLNGHEVVNAIYPLLNTLISEAENDNDIPVISKNSILVYIPGKNDTNIFTEEPLVLVDNTMYDKYENSGANYIGELKNVHRRVGFATHLSGMSGYNERIRSLISQTDDEEFKPEEYQGQFMLVQLEK